MGTASCYSDNTHFQSADASYSHSHSLKHHLWSCWSVSFFFPCQLLQPLSSSVAVNRAQYLSAVFTLSQILSVRLHRTCESLHWYLHVLWIGWWFLHMASRWMQSKALKRCFFVSLCCYNKSPAASARSCHVRFEQRVSSDCDEDHGQASCLRVEQKEISRTWMTRQRLPPPEGLWSTHKLPFNRLTPHLASKACWRVPEDGEGEVGPSEVSPTARCKPAAVKVRAWLDGHSHPEGDRHGGTMPHFPLAKTAGTFCLACREQYLLCRRRLFEVLSLRRRPPARGDKLRSPLFK